MLRDFITEAVKSSIFELPIFGGSLIVRGRILSPSEIERASLRNSLLLQTVLQEKGGASEIERLSEDLNNEETSDEAIERAYRFLSRVRPEQLEKVSENQDSILCLCVTHARKSEEGENWERLHLVREQAQQNPETCRLWVGVLSTEDRNAILEKAMTGHKEAGDYLRNFRG